MSREIAVFDVDGIILDSTDECLVVAWNAYQEYIGSNDFIRDISDADPDYSNKFRKTRKYVRSMGEYLVVFEVDYDQIKLQEEYEEILSRVSFDEIESFAKVFFNARNELKKMDYSHWLSLHRIYDGIRRLLLECNRGNDLYIVTGKDKESVIDLLASIDVHVKLDRVLDKQSAGNKLESLRLISEIEAVDKDKVKFIDDNVTHLIGPKEDGFNVVIGDWGYALPEHVGISQECNIPVLSISQAYDFFAVEL